jgi:hypothetical protein
MAINLTILKPLRLFSMGIFEGLDFQKNPHKIPEPKAAMQSEMEAFFAETVTKVLNNFVLLFA